MALYLVVGVTVALLEPSGGQAPWYPPVAIGVMMLLERGPRTVLVVLLCDITVALVQFDFDVLPGVVSGSVTALEVLVVWTLLRRFGVSRHLRRVEDVVLMAAAGAIGALGAATLGTLLLAAVGFDDARGQWTIWAIGDLTGLTIVLPVLLLVMTRRSAWRTLLSIPARRRFEFCAVTTASLLLVGGYFVRVNPHEINTTSAGVLMLCLLPVFWIAVRFGRLRTAIATLAIDITASLAFAGLGPHLFVDGTETHSWSMATVQLPMFSTALAALGVAVSVGAAQRAFAREQAMVNSSPVGIISLDRFGAVTSWNLAAQRIFGYSADEAIGRIPPMIPPEGREQFKVRFAEGLVAPHERRLEYRHKDGTTVIARVFTSPLVDATGARTGEMGVIEDVTAVQRMQDHQALLNTAIDQAAESIVVTDLDAHIIYANPSAATTSGYTADEVMGQNPRIFKSDLHDDAFYRDMWDTLTSGGTWSGVMVNKRKNGELYHEQVGIKPVVDVEGRAIAYVAVKHDLSVQRELEADLQRDRDTRSRVMAIMERIRSGDTMEGTATIMTRAIIDVTDFDFALVLLHHRDGSVEIIGEAGAVGEARVGRVVTSDGGATELLALTGRSAWWLNAASIAGRMHSWGDRFRDEALKSVAFAPMRWNGDLFGVVVVGSRADDSTEWMDHQIALLGEVGTLGGVLIGAQLEQARSDDIARAEIRDVIDEQRFHPVFQPYVDLQTGEITGYEALTRFDDGTRPDLKIRSAWDAGLGIELEIALAAAALEAADRLLPGVDLSVNFSPETILSGQAATVVRGRTRPVVIEVTEHTAIDDYPTLREALHKCGPVKVSVDDAGAGFSSLRHILELEPDVVKLDIGLIHGIDTDLARQALAAGLSHYAQQTGTLLIAEGVETADEAATVRSLGVHWGQGYYFGRPSRTG